MTAHHVDTPRRSVEATIELPASSEEVWRAITDASEIVKWFCFEAEIGAGPGALARLRWTDEFDWTYRIEAWEPGRRLRMVSAQERSDDPALLALEWLLEARGGATVLRVVHSGFGYGAEWDDEVDGTGRGWYGELRNLRHYLAHHRGKRRSVAWLLARTAGETAATLWSKLMGRDGLVAEGSLEGLGEGDRYRIRAATGEVFEGTVLMNSVPKDFAGTVDHLNDGILRYGWEGSFGTVWLTTYEVDEKKIDRFVAEWSGRMTRLLGSAPEVTRARS
ncbi:MAG: SRPBCC family protein [Gemmatimonadales bacterium]